MFSSVIKNAIVCKRQIADFVQSITGVGNQLAKEDLLVAVEGVDDQRQQLVNVSREKNV